jgi:hypothetical protein
VLRINGTFNDTGTQVVGATGTVNGIVQAVQNWFSAIPAEFRNPNSIIIILCFLILISKAQWYYKGIAILALIYCIGVMR